MKFIKNFAFWILPVVLLSLNPILYIWSNNVDHIYIKDVAIWLCLSSVISLIVLAVLSFFAGVKKAALFSMLLIFVFYNYGYIYKNFDGAVQHRYLLMATAIVIGVLGVVLYRLRNISVVLGQFLLCVVGAQFIMLMYPVASDIMRDASHADESGPSSSRRGEAEAHYPDIYYLVLDTYGNERVLREIYNYDNNAWLDELESRGFTVSRNSYANYMQTFLSMSSTLNMDYLDYAAIDDDPYPLPVDRTEVYNNLRNSEVLQFVQEKGYTFIQFNSGWFPTDSNPHADEFIDTSMFGEKELHMVIMETTVLSILQPWKIVGYDQNDRFRNLYLTMFDKLMEIPDRSEKTFTLFHILCPHPPYILKEDGSPYYDHESKYRFDPSGRQGYVEMVKFTNRKVTEFIERVMSTSPNAIIIIQGDHGPAYTLTDEVYDEGSELPTIEMVRERNSILMAAYMPDGKLNDFYEGVTPVNLFRMVFNQTFGTSHEMLPDRIMFSAAMKPYRFHEYSRKDLE